MQTAEPKQRRWKWISVFVAVLLVVSGTGYLAYSYYQPDAKQAIQNALGRTSVSLDVKAYHANGQMFADVKMPHDLIVDEFNGWVIDLLSVGVTMGGYTQCRNCNFVGKSTTCVSPYYCGLSFEIGTSNTAATRADVSMGAPYTPAAGSVLFPDTATNPTATATANPATCTTGATDSISGMSGTQSITSSVTIWEVGAYLVGYSGASYSMMTFHDILPSGINVVSGDSVVVSYALNLAVSGFNNNLCAMLAGFLAGDIASGGHVQITMTDYSYAAYNFYAWCTSGGSDKIYTTGCANFASAEASLIQLGSGSQTWTPSSIWLSNPIYAGALTKVSYSSTLATATLYWTASVTYGTSATVTNAALVILAQSLFVMFGTSFSGQPLTASVPFVITLKVGD